MAMDSFTGNKDDRYRKFSLSKSSNRNWKPERRREARNCIPWAGDAVHKAVDPVAGDASGIHNILCNLQVNGLQRRQCVALYLNGAPVLPLPSNGAQIPLKHHHIEPFSLSSQSEHQASDPPASYEDAELLLPSRLRNRGFLISSSLHPAGPSHGRRHSRRAPGPAPLPRRSAIPGILPQEQGRGEDFR